jgi:tetratricopeptide (TPR) repeat protein
MGVRQYLVKDYKDAIDSLTKSYNINQVDTTIISIGDIFYELKKYDKALEWYKKAG